jgi:hypothetical protein
VEAGAPHSTPFGRAPAAEALGEQLAAVVWWWGLLLLLLSALMLLLMFHGVLLLQRARGRHSSCPLWGRRKE